MKNHSPAFQFYPSDYLSDEKVQSMSIEGEGCYIRLMCYCWKEGSIPADREAIAKLCKGYNGPGIDEAMSCFKKAKTAGRLAHNRLIEERSKQENHSKLMQEAGLRGAEKRWLGHSQAMATHIASDGSSSSSSSSINNTLSREFEEGDITATELLISLMLKNNPKSNNIARLTPKAKEAWHNEVRLMRERDGHSIDEIKAIITFSQSDTFWRGNILSMTKLRKQWDTLWLRAGKGKPVEESPEEFLRRQDDATFGKGVKKR